MVQVPPQEPDVNVLAQLARYLFGDQSRMAVYPPGHRGNYRPGSVALQQREEERLNNRTRAGTFHYRPPAELPPEEPAPAPAATMPLPGRKPAVPPPASPPSWPTPRHKPAESITVAEALNRAMRAGAPVQPGMTPGDFEALARAHGFTGVYR